MKRLTIFFFILIAILGFSACSDEPIVRNPSEQGVWINIMQTEEGIVNTRAGEDEAINNLYILVFNKDADDGQLIDWALASAVGTSTYFGTLKDDTNTGVMYVVANINVSGASPFPATLGELKKNLIATLKTNNGNIIEDPHQAPMSSLGEPYDKAVSTEMTFELTRAVAKVVVSYVPEANGSHKAFSIQGVNLGNAPTKGYVFPNQGSITDKAHYAGKEGGASSFSPEYMMCAANGNVTNPIYLYESPAGNETFAIIKGEYDGVVGYHKLNIWKKDTRQFYDITRNYQYAIKINKIATAGYRTAAEAIKNIASNAVDYDIEVTDPSSHDIITNGKQFLGVSNSSLVIYQTGTLNNVEATILSYSTEAGWEPGTMTLKGVGLAFVDGSTTSSFPAGTKGESIKVNLTNDFKEGSLELRVGDLCKVIKLIRYDNLAAVPSEMEFSNVAIGDCSQSGNLKSDIRFTETSGIYPPTALDEVFVSNSSKIFAVVSSNIGYPKPAPRTGQFFVASAKDEGRTKIQFYQEAMDVYQGSMQIQPYTYVGTFHRWNQMAERVIRIKTISKDANASWTARVIKGEDFIELDEHRSPDTGITMYPYGCNDVYNPTVKDNAQWTTDDDIEANCQFTSEQKGKIVVKGTGNSVYFRVGMKSKLQSVTTAPRYGLIALNYRSHTGADATHFIYVRQGEEADFMMRERDASSVISVRNHVTKILPYNVTVPDAQKGNFSYDIPENDGTLTQYPSQGGYLFWGYSRTAMLGKGPNNTRPVQGTDGNPCPAGYRMFTDNFNGDIGTSEVRQSWWLNPRSGDAKSNFDNLLRGYIADGYYDRRTMRIPNTQGYTNEGKDEYKTETVDGVSYPVPTVVSDGAYMGFAGMLLYNPYNNASIFIPACGSWQKSWTSYIEMYPRAMGSEGSIWTSTESNSGSSYPWYLASGPYGPSSTPWVFDCYNRSAATQNALSVRCVKN